MWPPRPVLILTRHRLPSESGHRVHNTHRAQRARRFQLPSGQSGWFSQQTGTCSCFSAAGAPSDVIIHHRQTRTRYYATVSHIFGVTFCRKPRAERYPRSPCGPPLLEEWREQCDAGVRIENVAGDNRGAELTEVLRLSANKLFSTAGVRTDFAEGLAHSLNCINNREKLWEYLRDFAPFQSGGTFLSGLCRIVPHPCLHVVPYRWSSALCTCQSCHPETRLRPGPGSRTACWVIVAMMIWHNDCWTKFITVWTSWCWQLGYKILLCVISFLIFIFSLSSLAVWSVCGRFNQRDYTEVRGSD